MATEIWAHWCTHHTGAPPVGQARLGTVQRQGAGGHAAPCCRPQARCRRSVHGSRDSSFSHTHAPRSNATVNLSSLVRCSVAFAHPQNISEGKVLKPLRGGRTSLQQWAKPCLQRGPEPLPGECSLSVRKVQRVAGEAGHPFTYSLSKHPLKVQLGQALSRTVRARGSWCQLPVASVGLEV